MKDKNQVEAEQLLRLEQLVRDLLDKVPAPTHHNGYTTVNHDAAEVIKHLLLDIDTARYR